MDHIGRWLSLVVVILLVFLDDTGKPLVNSLALLITGGVTLNAEVKLEDAFHQNTSKVLLEADSCFKRVIIPTGHDSYEDFEKACTASLTFGGVGYGRF